MGRKRKKYRKVDVNLRLDPRVLEEINKLQVNKSVVLQDKLVEILKDNGINIDLEEKD